MRPEVQGESELVELPGYVVSSGLTPLVVPEFGLASVEERALHDAPQLSAFEQRAPRTHSPIPIHDYSVYLGIWLQSLADARMVVVVVANIAELLPVH